MFIDKAIADFLRNQLTIELPDIALSQIATTSPLVYRGPGNMRQDSQGRIEITCYADTQDEDGGLRTFFTKLSKTPQSLLVDESEYYEGVAREFGAATWLLGRSQASTNSGSGHQRIVVRTSPYMLSQTTSRSGSKFRLRMIFAHQKRCHWSALLDEQATVVEVEPTLKFSMKAEEQDDDHIVVSVESVSPFPDDFRLRLLEALRFVCALPLNPCVIDENGASERIVELWPGELEPDKHAPMPPLRMNGEARKSDISQLFRKYLSYVMKNGTPGLVHRCSVQLDHLRQCQTNSIGAQAVATSVAAEGIANLLPSPSRQKDHEDELLACGTALGEFISGGTWSDTVRKRVRGFADNLRAVRAIDRMYAQVAQGNALEVDVKAWDGLRHQWVHASPSNRKGSSRENIASIVHSLHSVTRLIYSMIFGLIGYEGEFVDWVDPNFRLRKFPFSATKIA